jgi:protein-tyrosine-phosphatase
MKILFICKANVSRSQMAAALYNEMTCSHDADSAGVDIDFPNETLAERKQRLGASHTLNVMQEIGLDLSQNRRTQLTKEMLKGYDRVISMLDEELAPEWLVKDPHYTYWAIADPISKDLAVTKSTMKEIQSKLRDLLEE